MRNSRPYRTWTRQYVSRDMFMENVFFADHLAQDLHESYRQWTNLLLFGFDREPSGPCGFVSTSTYPSPRKYSNSLVIWPVRT